MTLTKGLTYRDPSTTPEPIFISLELVVSSKNVSEYDIIGVARVEIGATA
jgi:hypothetical protein